MSYLGNRSGRGCLRNRDTPGRLVPEANEDLHGPGCQPMSYQEAPPSRKEREKGRAPASEGGGSLGQPANSLFSTGAVAMRECGGLPTEYFSRFKSIGLS